MADPLMMSVSGVRGIAGTTVNPSLVVDLVSSFAVEMRAASDSKLIVVGRDSRVSGPWVSSIVEGVLLAMGLNVLSIGIVPTPTVQFVVKTKNAAGGIIITSSHNPEPWNGLKFVDDSSLFLSPAKCDSVYARAKARDFTYASYLECGTLSGGPEAHKAAIDSHVQACLELPYIDVEKIRSSGLKVALDAVNGAGGEILSALLAALSVDVVPLNLEPTGKFAHTPEPVPENLGGLCKVVRSWGTNFGIAVDPDADRCVIVDETGIPIGEEYTLAIAVNHYLSKVEKPSGPIVKNLSTSRAVDDVAKKFGVDTLAAAVGEINVALKMVEVNACIGGEGNGGVMLPDVHIGRDSLVATVLIVAAMSEFDGTMARLKASLPQWQIVKLKAPLEGLSPDAVLDSIKNEWTSGDGEASGCTVNDLDGVRIDTKEWWVHLRKSNTEPIVRVIGEAASKEKAMEVCTRFMQRIQGK